MQQKQMKQHQMKQHQMTQHQMTPRQMTQQQFTRQHNEHEHTMTIANPQRDTRRMAIPSNTFEEIGGGIKFGGGSLPFRWLRTWLFSLLALIALPIGGMLIYVGTAMQENVNEAWVERTATVDRVNDEQLRFEYQDDAGTRTRSVFNFEPGNFLASMGDNMVLSLSVCDLLSRFIVPSEEDATFTIWTNPDDVADASCIPVSSDTGALLLIVGWILVALSAFRLLRTIQGAASKPAQQASY